MQHAISLFPSPLSPAEEQPSRQKQIALLLSVASPARHAPQAYTCTQHTLEQTAIAATLSLLALSLHCLFFTERKQQQQQPISSAVSATRKQLSSNSHSSLVLSLSAKRRAAPPSCSRGHAELKLAPSSPSRRCSKAPPPPSEVRRCPTTPDLQELGAASPDRATSSSPATAPTAGSPTSSSILLLRALPDPSNPAGTSTRRTRQTRLSPKVPAVVIVTRVAVSGS
ncbi:uncharacterized protein LOC133885447 [Phragmites australis]|uniref:uncharacterized protein LOC133885447 n=1 Tax=Phragmites australis TaxID=29695 RepID=UPI002D77684B|nr:uncharacterized protein LOC133885447 [Phragmites australis]